MHQINNTMVNIVIPMAGNGSRFPKEKYFYPKPLLDVNGQPMIRRAILSTGFEGKWHFVLRDNEFLELTKKVILETVKDPEFVVVDYETEGPACSVLLFKDKINNDNELIVLNCDQILEWDCKLFYHNVQLYDGAVVTYYSDSEKNSYAKINSKGIVTELREKEVISNIALTGIHYWKKGRYFVDSAESMMADNERAPNGEFYVAPTYNYMINQKLSVGIYHIPNEQFHPTGIPVDLDKFIKYEKI